MKKYEEELLKAILDPESQEKYESELKTIFENLEQSDDLSQAIEEILEQTDEIVEIQSKLILVIKAHIRRRLKALKKEKELNKDEKDKEKDKEKEQGIDEDEINKDISRLAKRLVMQLDQDLEYGQLLQKDLHYSLDRQAKKDLKRILKGFATYEVYKVMNPKRIAGETKKQNFRNNLFFSGKALAMNYEGGEKSAKKRYGTKEVQKMVKQAKDFQKGGSEKDKGWER